MSGPQPPFVFQLFADFRGMHRWVLLDASGKLVRQSQNGFAGLAAAWRDAEATRDEGFIPARIDRPEAS